MNGELHEKRQLNINMELLVRMPMACDTKRKRVCVSTTEELLVECVYLVATQVDFKFVYFDIIRVKSCLVSFTDTIIFSHSHFKCISFTCTSPAAGDLICVCGRRWRWWVSFSLSSDGCRWYTAKMVLPGWLYVRQKQDFLMNSTTTTDAPGFHHLIHLVLPTDEMNFRSRDELEKEPMKVFI